MWLCVGKVYNKAAVAVASHKHKEGIRALTHFKKNVAVSLMLA